MNLHIIIIIVLR